MSSVSIEEVVIEQIVPLEFLIGVKLFLQRENDK